MYRPVLCSQWPPTLKNEYQNNILFYNWCPRVNHDSTHSKVPRGIRVFGQGLKGKDAENCMTELKDGIGQSDVSRSSHGRGHGGNIASLKREHFVIFIDSVPRCVSPVKLNSPMEPRYSRAPLRHTQSLLLAVMGEQSLLNCIKRSAKWLCSESNRLDSVERRRPRYSQLCQAK